jgi:hypothetical protein
MDLEMESKVPEMDLETDNKILQVAADGGSLDT